MTQEAPISVLGTPLMWPLTLRHPALPGGLLLLPDAPLVNINLQKTIVTTPVAGRNGTFKELISAEDWQIDIRGVWAADAYPTEALDALRNLIAVDATLDVEHVKLAHAGITRIAIQSLNLPDFEGAEDWIPYQISAISDTPYELEITE